MEQEEYRFYLRRARPDGMLLRAVDASGRIRYEIRRKRWSVGRKMLVTDPEGNTVAEIRRGFSPVVPLYRVRIPGQPPITVRRKLALAPVYEVSGPGWRVTGSGGRYTGCSDENQSRPVFELYQDAGFRSERFAILTNDPGRALIIICVAAAIDAANEDIRRTRKR